MPRFVTHPFCRMVAAPLVVAALAVPDLAVGPLVLNTGFHQPVLLARTAASVDRMTGGRLVLGLGTGYTRSEHDAIGVPLQPPPARIRLFAETLAVLRSLLDTGRASLNGEFHHVAVDDLGVRPVQTHVPFLIGGHGRRVVSIAAQYADIFQFTGLTHDAAGNLSPGGFALADIRQRATSLTAGAGPRDPFIERSARATRRIRRQAHWCPTNRYRRERNTAQQLTGRSER